MSLTKTIAYNTIVQIIGRFLNLIISFSSVALLTRYLGVIGYGEYTTAFALVNLFAVLTDLGFFTTLVRELSIGRHTKEKIVNNILTLRSVVALVVFTLAVIIAQFIPSYSADVKRGVIFAALAIFALTLNQTLVGVFQANFRMDKAVLGDFLGRAVTLALIFFGIRHHASLQQIIAYYIVGNSANLLLTIALSSLYIKFRLAFDWPFWKYTLRTTISLGFLLIIGMVNFRNDMVFLGFFKSAKDVGIYGAAYKMFDQLIVLPSMFLGTTLPAIATLIVQKSERLTAALQKSFNFLFAMAAPTAVFGIFYSREIINFIAGRDFTSASTISLAGHPITAVTAFQILMLNIILIFIGNLTNYTIIAANQQKRLLLPNLLFMLVNIVLNIIFIPRYSYLAAALTTFITEVLLLSNSLYVMRVRLGYSFHYWATVLKTALVCTLTVGLALMLRHYYFLVVLPVLLVFYFTLMYLIRGIDREVVAELIGRKSAA